MKKNEVLRLEITGLTNEGAGVARHEGMAVFVPFSAVGDVLDCRVLKVRSSFSYAKIERLITPSPDRVENDCLAYTKCGGCCFRHISYAAELKAKADFVKSAFLRIGGLDVPFDGILSTEEFSRYRNKAQLPVAEVNGAPVCGYFSPRSHRVIPCGDCLLSPEIFSKICAEILKYQRDLGLSCYDEASGKGLLRHIYLRRGHKSGEIMVCLVVTKPTRAYDGLAKILAEKFSAIKTVVLNVNPERTNVILGERVLPIYGGGKINDEICGVAVELSPDSFYQVNTAAAELVYKKASEYAELSGSETLLDLYCGAGTVGLSMAKGLKKLIGVEIVPEAVKNARANAERNGVKNAEFIASDAGKAASELAERGERPDVVTVDPPRKGCDRATLDAVIKMSPRRVVMISCDPATAARDSKYLAEHGYAAARLCAVDMFPRTNHVETVVKFLKKNTNKRRISNENKKE